MYILYLFTPKLDVNHQLTVLYWVGGLGTFLHNLQFQLIGADLSILAADFLWLCCA